MEGLIVLVALFVVFGPITIAIVALAKASAAKSELSRIQRRLAKLENVADARQAKDRPAAAASRASASAPPDISPPEAAVPVRGGQAAESLPKPVPPINRPAPSVATPQPKQSAPQHAGKTSAPKPTPPKKSMGLEFLMGGRATAFIGVGVLVIGIALLVGYAVQNAWLGPGARVLLGLASGLGLAGLGYWVSRRDDKYAVFSRVLTGGGSALFYFTVFAAYAFYDLIGALMAGVGLFLCATGVFGLALFYRSRSVAILGVLGAFVTPLLIGGEMDAGVFPLVYVALVNVPVILLGVRRDWQSLYNLAFFFTVVHSVLWMERLDAGDFIPGLVFILVLYIQFAFLGLLKLRGEQKERGRIADLVRLILLSLFLPGMVYWLFGESGHDSWTGLAFAGLALIQFGVSATARKTVARFTGEITAFVAGGVFAAAMALPVQFDGEWVSLGWGIEGAILAWFALRVRSPVLRTGAFLLGLIGVLRVVLIDVNQYTSPPNLFVNARFLVGFISTGLLAYQGKMLERYPDETSAKTMRDITWWIAGVAIIVLSVSDVFWTRGFDTLLSWGLTSLILMAWGFTLTLFAPRGSSIVWLGRVLLLIASAKVVLIDGTIYSQPPNLFLNGRFALGVLSVALLLVQTRFGRLQEDDRGEEWRDLSWWAASLAFMLLVTTDIFWTIGFDQHASWLLSSAAFVAGGAVLTWFAPKQSNVIWLGRGLLVLAPIKLLLIDTLMAGPGLSSVGAPFANRVIWFQLALLAVMIFLIGPRLVARGEKERDAVATVAMLTHLLSLICGLSLVSLEIARLHTDWADVGITILWALSALALILYGMKWRKTAHRYFGLVLVALATLKVLIVDSSELAGLQRIFAFIGTGILLLLLAFAYQKASVFFESLGDDPE